MSAPKGLGERIADLEAIEEIRNLKARYCRYIDLKQWAELGQIFATDAMIQPSPTITLKGREEIVQFLSSVLSSVVVVHQVHQSEIEITGEDTARGIWGEYDGTIVSGNNASHLAYGFYHEEYLKEDGRWRIAYSRIDRIYTQTSAVHLDAGKVDFLKNL